MKGNYEKQAASFQAGFMKELRARPAQRVVHKAGGLPGIDPPGLRAVTRENDRIGRHEDEERTGLEVL